MMGGCRTSTAKGRSLANICALPRDSLLIFAPGMMKDAFFSCTGNDVAGGGEWAFPVGKGTQFVCLMQDAINSDIFSPPL